jgi:hypothetical protein
MSPEEQDMYFHILERLVEGGQPVKKTLMGIELASGRYLCNLRSMNWLCTSGYVTRTADGRFEATPLGIETCTSVAAVREQPTPPGA